MACGNCKFWNGLKGSGFAICLHSNGYVGKGSRYLRETELACSYFQYDIKEEIIEVDHRFTARNNRIKTGQSMALRLGQERDNSKRTKVMREQIQGDIKVHNRKKKELLDYDMMDYLDSWSGEASELNKTLEPDHLPGRRERFNESR